MDNYKIGDMAEKIGHYLGYSVRWMIPKRIRVVWTDRLDKWLQKRSDKIEALKLLEMLCIEFNDWKERYYPNLSGEEALKLYPGLQLNNITDEDKNNE
jgi:ABC-type proline/glycine betaine transport system ATPase subunit